MTTKDTNAMNGSGEGQDWKSVIAQWAEMGAEDRAAAEKKAAETPAKKAEVSRFNEEIATLEGARSSLSKIVNSGSEDHDVECGEYMVFATNEVRIVRLDTGELVQERAMTRSERQVELPWIGSEDADATDITSPEALLRDAAEGHGDEKPAKKRGRKS